MAFVSAAFSVAVPSVPVGSVQPYAGASAPNGWLLCDSGQYLITQYGELYSVLGTTYGTLTNGSGGAGSTHFRVPDMRGRVPMGAGTGAQQGGSGSGVITGGTALTARTVGEFGGDERLAQHNHDLRLLSGSTPYWALDIGTGGNYGGYPTANAGAGQSGNMPPFVVFNYIVKATSDIPRGGITASSTPPIVTSLPANPQFGDQVVYAADATNGVYWTLQYDGSGTYPWKFVGGAPLTAQVDTDENIVAGTITYAALATAGPSITLALAGDYVISQGLRGYPFATTQECRMSYDIGATPASDNDSVLLDCASGFGENGSRTRLKTGISASTAIVSKYRHSSTGAGGNFSNRWMTATPVRVKAA